jgi:hypothetical protein
MDVKIFLQDIDNAKAEDVDTGEGNKVKLYQLILPRDHASHWFSSLNQARLMMDEKWKFHNENDQFVPFLPPAVQGDMDPQERFASYMRYEFYCMIQEWLVRHVF